MLWQVEFRRRCSEGNGAILKIIRAQPVYGSWRAQTVLFPCMLSLVWLSACLALLLYGAHALPEVMVTNISGTWSSGAGVIETGQTYFNIVNDSFMIPPITGQSYSFAPDSETTGKWEQYIYKITNSCMFVLQQLTQTTTKNSKPSLDATRPS